MCSVGLSSGEYGGSARMANVFRKYNVFGCMPSGRVHYHYDSIVAVCNTGFRQQCIHSFCIAKGRNNRARFSCLRTNCCECIDVLPYCLLLHNCSVWSMNPAFADMIHPAKRGLVLKKDHQRPCVVIC